MAFRVEHECSQCGAELEMAEIDRLLHCNFCNVKSFLVNSNPLQFVLPRQEPDPYTIYVPYHRFKGAIYSCLASRRIEHHLADLSSCAVKLSFLPMSLGLRPQAMKMRFATPEIPGTFLKSSTEPDDILQRAAKNLNIRNKTVLHQSFVGDVLNTIYLPLSIRDEQIFDGIINRPLAKISEDGTPFAETQISSFRWKPKFLAALCPQCGWNLEGESDSVVLTCINCNTAWQAVDNSFSALQVKITPSADENAQFIPFWNFKVELQGLKLDTFADFIRTTNQPLVVMPDWEKLPLHFIVPAFRIRPDDFLRLGSQMTVSQRYSLPTVDKIPGKNLYPVTLQHYDVARSIKTILAETTVSGLNVFPYLSEVKYKISKYFLHYLPFEQTSHELKQPDIGVTINQRVLNYGRSL